MIENAMTRLRKRLAAERWALLPLRLMIGFGFAAHGYAKLSRGPDGFAGILAAMGIPAPGPMAWLTSLLEFLGGISLMLGAAVAPLSVPLAAIMATAMFGVHFRYGFSSIRLKGISAEGRGVRPRWLRGEPALHRWARGACSEQREPAFHRSLARGQKKPRPAEACG
jgi:uncharacterized membrane protein YphA (DoxX/SURF4 family)